MHISQSVTERRRGLSSTAGKRERAREQTGIAERDKRYGEKVSRKADGERELIRT